MGARGPGSLMHESRAQSEDSICLGLDPSCAKMGYPGRAAGREHLGGTPRRAGVSYWETPESLVVVFLRRTGNVSQGAIDGKSGARSDGS